MKKYISYYFVMFKVGLLTFGGGIVMLPIITEELTSKGIANENEIFEAYSNSQALPGIIAVNTCVFLGYKLDKLKGAIAMTLGVISPSVIIIFVLSILLSYLNDTSFLNILFNGMRVGVVAILIVTLFNLLKRIHDSIPSLIIAFFSFIVATFTETPIYLIIIIGGFFSMLYFRSEEE